MIDDLRTAIGFLTRIPISTPRVVLSDAAPWFPVVGLGIGLIQAAALLGFNEVLPVAPSAVLAVAIAALVTGAFHHDGLADMADAFGGGWNVEQRLTIMKDSRLGTYGTSALILAFATEIAVLASLSAERGARAVIAAHCLSRAIAVAAMRLAPLAPTPTPTEPVVDPAESAEATTQRRGMGGLGAAYAQDLGAGPTAVAVLFGVAVAAIAFADLRAAAAVLFAVAVAVAVVVLAIRKVGGITGDVLGAIQQMASLAILLVAATTVTA